MTARRQFLKSIIKECQTNINIDKYKVLGAKIDKFTQQANEDSLEKVKIIDIYADQVKQANKTTNFKSIEVIKDSETLNSQNDYDNFLTPAVIKQAKL